MRPLMSFMARNGRPSARVPSSWTGGMPGCCSWPVIRASSSEALAPRAESAAVLARQHLDGDVAVEGGVARRGRRRPCRRGRSRRAARSPADWREGRSSRRRQPCPVRRWRSGLRPWHSLSRFSSVRLRLVQRAGSEYTQKPTEFPPKTHDRRTSREAFRPAPRTPTGPSETRSLMAGARASWGTLPSERSIPVVARSRWERRNRLPGGCCSSSWRRR